MLHVQQRIDRRAHQTPIRVSQIVDEQLQRVLVPDLDEDPGTGELIIEVIRLAQGACDLDRVADQAFLVRSLRRRAQAEQEQGYQESSGANTQHDRTSGDMGGGEMPIGNALNRRTIALKARRA